MDGSCQNVGVCCCNAQSNRREETEGKGEGRQMNDVREKSGVLISAGVCIDLFGSVCM